jgi:hypothetical protein
MAGSVTGLNTFGSQAGPIPTSELDTNFSDIAGAVNTLNTYSNYYADAGSVNAMAVTIPSTQTFALTAGLQLQVKVLFTNTGSVTLNVNGTGAVQVIGSNGLALIAGELLSGSIINVVYTGSAWQVIGTAQTVTQLVAGSNVILSPTNGTGIVTINATAASGNVYYPVTAGETAISVTIVNYQYPPYNALRYGADPTGANDSTTKIQAAIDAAIYDGASAAYIPSGTYKTTKTINVGYGVGYCAVSLIGAGSSIVSANYGNGFTRITPTFVNAPVINIQGVRNAGVQNLFIDASGVNSFTGYLVNSNLAAAAVFSNYYSSTAGVSTQTHTPFCGVCIDGYSGTTPGTPYPTPTYPAYFGTVSSAYGKNLSSIPVCENVAIQNTFIGICDQPNSDGNGDFARFDKCVINNCAIGIAICNVNARNTDYTDIQFNGNHTNIDSITYASINGSGNFAGNLSNISANYCYRLFNVSLDYSTSSVVSNYYSEVCMSIGNFVGGKSGVSFIGCTFSCKDYLISGGVSWSNVTQVYSTPVINANVAKFTSCLFNEARIGFWFALSSGFYSFDSCVFTPDVYYNGVGLYRDVYEQAATEAWAYVFFPNATSESTSTNVLTNCHLLAKNVTFNQDDHPSYSTWWSNNFNYYGTVVPYIVSNTQRTQQIGSSGSWTASGGGFTTSALGSNPQLGDTMSFNYNMAYAASVNAGTYQWNLLYNYQYTSSGGYTLPSLTIGANYQLYPISLLYTYSTASSTGALAFSTVAGNSTVTMINSSGTITNIPFTSANSPLITPNNSCAVIQLSLPFPPGTTVSSISNTAITMSTSANITGLWSLTGIGRFR